MNDLARAELLDHELAEAMDKLVIVKSAIYTSGECDPREPPPRQDTTGRLHLMGHDPRLPKMQRSQPCSISSSIGSVRRRTCCRVRVSH